MGNRVIEYSVRTGKQASVQTFKDEVVAVVRTTSGMVVVCASGELRCGKRTHTVAGPLSGAVRAGGPHLVVWGPAGALRVAVDSGLEQAVLRSAEAHHFLDVQVANDGSMTVGLLRDSVLVWSETHGRCETVESKGSQDITCCVLHESAGLFTGGRNGVITWWNVLRPEFWTKGRKATSMRHWHAHAVSAMLVTPEGAQLVSGGEEAVLVLWDLNSADEKQTIPRWGASIENLAMSADAATIALVLLDNSIRFFDTRGGRKGKTLQEILPGLLHQTPSGHVCVPSTAQV